MANVAYFITCHEQTRYNRVFYYRFLGVRIELLRTCLSSLQLVVCLVAAVQRLSVHHHIADCIFWSFVTYYSIQTQYIFVSLVYYLLPKELTI